VLIGDIGGTNARFALVPDPRRAASGIPPGRNRDFPTIEDAVASVLDGSRLKPRAAIIERRGANHRRCRSPHQRRLVIKPNEVIGHLKIEDVILPQ